MKMMVWWWCWDDDDDNDEIWWWYWWNDEMKMMAWWWWWDDDVDGGWMMMIMMMTMTWYWWDNDGMMKCVRTHGCCSNNTQFGQRQRWAVKGYKLDVITSEFSSQFYHIIASSLIYLSLIHPRYLDKIYPKSQGIVKFCPWLAATPQEVFEENFGSEKKQTEKPFWPATWRRQTVTYTQWTSFLS